MRPLDQQICFTLYATSMAVTRAYKPLLDELGLTYPQYLVLSVLGEAGGLTIGGVAARLDLESSTVTPLVKRLEAAGLVTRTRSLDDERRVEVNLTPEGQALLERSDCLGDSLIERSRMSGQDLEALNKQIQALRDQINKA
ncbi:MarR family winged helix-turn-helix transcriptional regulator [Phenylobacterium sp.]|uniref:MarR family winged helix-turn-helix transcriptional regulator n=1 Tax=Phenylobacterium sp. TaxID=1871053 RepID=UPI002730DF50|nr:MarR family transcriptional regulator [Phenylobacterium sp.]MDP1617647.1 MarR family transcriptional regulator [Phenylobacterium sp.]MDP1987891.1 MarR family transcriptional regulator [Phenylobacterium sp.]